MAIQVVHVADPAAGAEWAYTIPGQYVVTLIGVQATITTHAPPGSSTDQSGNGNTLTYNPAMYPNETFGVTGPFGSGGGRAVDTTNYDSLAKNALGSAPNGGGIFDTATFTWEVLCQGHNTGNVTQVLGLILNPTSGGLVRCGISMDRGGGTLRGRGASSTVALGPILGSDTWGQVCASYDGAQWTGYKNGVASAPVGGAAPGLANTGLPLEVAGDGVTAGGLNGKIAALAYYGAVIPAANLLAHWNAVATSAAAYKAAVLADSPLAFWMLDDNYNTAARAVVLAVQNGAATVATFPVTVPLTTPGTFTYSWQTLGPGALTSADGTVITVPIPTMTLPPGYTIGSNTLDLTSTDQWSGITLWYDDGTGTPNPAGPGTAYLDALLVPNDWTG